MRTETVSSSAEQPAPAGASAGFEGYINKHECARLLGRTVRSVDTYMAEGLIPFYKLGRTVAFKWSEVDAHIKAHYRSGVRR